MTQFNQELIQKARKGEIAILNDGSVEELKQMLTAVWPDDTTTVRIESSNIQYFIRHPHGINRWFGLLSTPQLAAYSVKHFFMDQPESKESFKKYLDSTEPRTYRVTRQQMGRIDEAKASGTAGVIYKVMSDRFGLFATEAELTDTDVSMLNSIVPDPDIIKGIFPEYFFIPEGEPVLCRNMVDGKWKIRVSDGSGGAYMDGDLSGKSVGWAEIIPFTKNPPK